MSIKLDNTDAHEINETLFRLRKEGKAPAKSGQVLTLVVNTSADGYEQAMEGAQAAGELHPSRILVAVRGKQDEPGLSAEIQTEQSAAEVITLQFSGEVDQHATSVLLPLLLSELPVVIWSRTGSDDELGSCDLTSLSNRLIVDSSTASDPIAATRELARTHRPGSTDLSWTRLTRWRALLVAALNQVRSPVLSAEVVGPLSSAPSELLAAWLRMRLDVTVQRPDPVSSYPGLHLVKLATRAGDIVLQRFSPIEASLSLPGQPDRQVALARRTVPQLLSEELSQLSGDGAFDGLMSFIATEKQG
ncbi:glucose-6-phosphate dehydrogenase assembly protein OpcA [Propionimicrobium sp. PCR01-08-3]|uniref:glucose-6-phosphate dehydrogenase assembly protein OpcA n=1 Tax=Propionimicrobium sp. PCR01-08-3 TaxID=3052086 RepID=UPI00255C8174|nr:glucose-6-phosphate dehydrogenase assembly protein OpcA [Propionimicrobium sp. PCR01-08-3]WIY81615.1 glucose-6-phosphate dehydrogenase assembly protein OpcA [Propionimicrobium sp. PCR01-08-3]